MQTGLFLVEGIHHVGAALEAQADIDRILYAPESLSSDYAQELIAQCKNAGFECIATSAEVFANFASKDHPAGIAAIVRQNLIPLSALPLTATSWYTAVVSPQDPGNVGALLRTVDATGADGLILLDGGVDPYHPTAVRASMGAIFHKPLVTGSFDDFSSWAEQNNLAIYGSSAKASQAYDQIKYQFPSVLLLGSEQKGLTDSQQEVCNTTVALLMAGKATSLNLAVAAGVLMYEMKKFRERS